MSAGAAVGVLSVATGREVSAVAITGTVTATHVTNTIAIHTAAATRLTTRSPGDVVATIGLAAGRSASAADVRKMRFCISSGNLG